MPQLEARHLKRMARDRFRLGMPTSVEFVRQVILTADGHNTERIIFNRRSNSSRSLPQEVDRFDATSKSPRALNVDAGVISAANHGLSVDGYPSDVSVRVPVPNDKLPDNRRDTKTILQKLVGPKVTVTGSV